MNRVSEPNHIMGTPVRPPLPHPRPPRGPVQPRPISEHVKHLIFIQIARKLKWRRNLGETI